jgi:hypothetical protein
MLSRRAVGYAGWGLPERNPDPHERIDALDVTAGPTDVA